MRRRVLNADPDRRTGPVPDRRHPSDITSLVASLAGLVGVVYVLGGLALYVELSRTGVPAGEALDQFSGRRFVVIGVPIAALAAVVGGAALYANTRWIGLKGGRRILMVAGFLAAAGLAGYFVFPIKLRHAVVELTGKPARCVAGAYISTDSLGVHLADGMNHQLKTIAGTQVARVTLQDKTALADQTISRSPCPRLPPSP